MFLISSYSALGGQFTPLSGPPPIGFSSKDSTMLTTGLLATMRDHDFYMEKFYNAWAINSPSIFGDEEFVSIMYLII